MNWAFWRRPTPPPAPAPPAEPASPRSLVDGGSTLQECRGLELVDVSYIVTFGQGWTHVTEVLLLFSGGKWVRLRVKPEPKSSTLGVSDTPPTKDELLWFAHELAEAQWITRAEAESRGALEEAKRRAQYESLKKEFEDASR